MSMNLRQIEVFRAVMSAGSISGASKILNVSQPAVSRLLAYTESRIGFPLFERIKGRLYATPEARRLFREVDHVYHGVQRVNEVAQSLAERRQGVLHIISSPSIGHTLIPQAIARLCAREPGVRVTFEFLSFEHAKERLLRQQADLGIISSAIDHPHLESVPLGRGQLVCLLPQGHRLARRASVSPADLHGERLIGYPQGTPFGRMVAEVIELAGRPIVPAIEVGSPQSACALVEAGGGVALVDTFSLFNWRERPFEIRPLSGAPGLTASLVFPRFEPLSQLSRLFSGVLHDLMEESGFSLPGLGSESEPSVPLDLFSGRAVLPPRALNIPS